MENRINQVEFDEFEKLLGEIPNVTSGAPSSQQPGSTYPSKGPANGTLGKKPSNDRSSLDENSSAKDIQQCGANQEDPKLPDDQCLTSALAELSFNDMSSPLVYGQYLNGIHELPCSFDYLSSLGPSLQNSCMRIDPEIGFQFVPNMPNVQGVEFPLFPNQQPYLHAQRLKQPQTTWGTTDESQYYRMHQQYLGMTPHFRIQSPILANGNMTPQHLLRQNFQNSRDDMHHFGLSNQEDLWNKASSVPRGVNFDRLWKHGFPEKVLPKSLGYNSHKNELFLDANQNGRVFSNNHYHRMPTNSCDDLKCNSLRPLLQKCSYHSIDEVVGRIYFMAKDQNGCRFLQRKFTEGTQKDIEMIFSEVIMHVGELMMDPFGNYLVQKLLEVCNEDQHMQILRTITRKSGDLVRISCDMHGTRAVQKIVETLKTPKQFLLLVSSLKPAIVTLMKNINGNHVAQRCLQYLLPEYSEFLYEAAFASCVELATDRHGCCVLQKCLSHCDGEKRHRLMCEITSNALILAQDQYGNYVVQFVLKTRVSWAILNVLDQLEGNYGDLSMQKYSSNVIEKCLKHATEERQSRIIQELISDHRFDQILQDPYGNYVIQAALKRSKATLRGALVEAIRHRIPLLRTSPYGKKVLQAIARTSHAREDALRKRHVSFRATDGVRLEPGCLV